MTVVYCTHADQGQAKALNPDRIDSPYKFHRVDYSATKIIIIGNHPKVEKAYRGILPVQVIESDKSEK